MREITTNQPIGSTVSDHDITHRIHNGRCLNCGTTKPLEDTHADSCKFHSFMSEQYGEKESDCKDCDKTLTPLGEALQSNCPRCNMRWIIHNCPEYPKLLDAKEMIKKIARGAILKETAEFANYFTSIKQDGEEFNVFITEDKIKTNSLS